jgi:hypothetical protein
LRFSTLTSKVYGTRSMSRSCALKLLILLVYLPRFWVTGVIGVFPVSERSDRQIVNQEVQELLSQALRFLKKATWNENGLGKNET